MLVQASEGFAVPAEAPAPPGSAPLASAELIRSPRGATRRCRR